MLALFQKLMAMLMSLLAIFGIGKGVGTPTQQNDPVASVSVKNNKAEFCFESNPSTGYTWTYDLDGDSVSLTKEDYVNSAGGNIAGAPGTQVYQFSPVRSGKTVVTFTYARPWENDPPLYTYTAILAVDGNLKIQVESFQSE